MNKKGFVLIETLVVTIFALFIFSVLYNSAVPLLGRYKELSYYDDLDTTYDLYYIRKFVVNDLNYKNISELTYKKLSINDFNDKDLYETVFNFLEINSESDLYFLNSDYLDEFLNDDNISYDIKDYIKRSNINGKVLILKKNNYISYINSCSKGDYACGSGKIVDISITPSTMTLNLKSNISGIINVENSCGTYTLESSDTSVATISKVDEDEYQVMAVIDGVSENNEAKITITATGQWGCSASTEVIVKNTTNIFPIVDISTTASTSCGDDCYKKGVEFTVTCSSTDSPITDFTVSGATITGDDYNKTATITYSSTGSKTISASCTNSFQTTTASKKISIKTYTASSSCGCSSYTYNCSCGCGYKSDVSCSSTSVSTTSSTSSGCSSACESKCTSLKGSYNVSACGYNSSLSSTTCSTYKTCWHT